MEQIEIHISFLEEEILALAEETIQLKKIILAWQKESSNAKKEKLQELMELIEEFSGYIENLEKVKLYYEKMLLELEDMA